MYCTDCDLYLAAFGQMPPCLRRLSSKCEDLQIMQNFLVALKGAVIEDRWVAINILEQVKRDQPHLWVACSSWMSKSFLTKVPSTGLTSIRQGRKPTLSFYATPSINVKRVMALKCLNGALTSLVTTGNLTAYKGSASSCQVLVSRMRRLCQPLTFL